MLRSLLTWVFFLVLGMASISPAFAQDPQYSQYYAAPLYLNPAMAGAEMMGRVGFNYRNQWPSLDAQFTTYSAYYDTYLPEYNSEIRRAHQNCVPLQFLHFIHTNCAWRITCTSDLDFKQATFEGKSDFMKIWFSQIK